MGSECPDNAGLQQYLSGELNETACLSIESHLQSCGVCRNLLSEVLQSSAVEPSEALAEPLEAQFSSLDIESKRQLFAIAAFGQATVAVPGESAGQSVTLPFDLPPRYLPVRRLGAGGMGQVWEVYDSVVGRSLAIKFLPSSAGGFQSLQRLLKEASLLGALKHPGIVQIYEVLTDTVSPAIVMELITGPSLQAFLAGGVSTERVTATFVAELCEAVQYAHDQRIVHRDLKPSNILLRRKPGVGAAAATRDLSAWDPVITDFGTGRIDGDETITVAGQIVGTPAYMAPEQARGSEEGKEAAVDIYGLGVVLYELLVGRPPFLADSPIVLLDLVKRGEPASPRLLREDLSQDLENICLKCLSPVPSDRYREARHLRDDLRAFLEGRPVTARRLSWLVRTIRWCRRNRRTAVLLFSLASVLVLISLQSVYFGVSQSVLLERANRLEAEANKSRQLSEDRALQLENSLKSAIEVAEQLMALTEGQAVPDPGWVQRRQQIRERAVKVYNEYVGQFCPSGLISAEHFRIACGLCSLRWQLTPDSITQLELRRLVDSWNAFPEAFQSSGDFLDLRASLFYVETEFHRRNRSHLQAAQCFLGWSAVLQKRAELHPEGGAALLQCLRISAGMMQNACGEFQQTGNHVAAAEAAAAGISILEKVMLTRNDDDDRDMLNFLFLSQLASENWILAGNAGSAKNTASRAVVKLSERPVNDPRAVPFAEKSKAKLEQILGE